MFSIKGKYFIQKNLCGYNSYSYFCSIKNGGVAQMVRAQDS